MCFSLSLYSVFCFVCNSVNALYFFARNLSHTSVIMQYSSFVVVQIRAMSICCFGPHCLVLDKQFHIDSHVLHFMSFVVPSYCLQIQFGG